VKHDTKQEKRAGHMAGRNNRHVRVHEHYTNTNEHQRKIPNNEDKFTDVLLLLVIPLPVLHSFLPTSHLILLLCRRRRLLLQNPHLCLGRRPVMSAVSMLSSAAIVVFSTPHDLPSPWSRRSDRHSCFHLRHLRRSCDACAWTWVQWFWVLPACLSGSP
jgi:hypothetical protein